MDPIGGILANLETDWMIFVVVLVLAIVSLIKILVDARSERRRKSEDRERKAESIRREKTLDSIDRFLRILSVKYTEEVTDRQMPVILNEFLSGTRDTIIVMATSTISKNDVESNQREVKAKVKQFIQNRMRECRFNLGLFKWKGRVLSECSEESWTEEISQGILTIVLVPRLTKDERFEGYKSVIDFLTQRFDEYRAHMLEKAYE